MKKNLSKEYSLKLIQAIEALDLSVIEALAGDILAVGKAGGQIFFCGNGGSAANAIHLANDFIYPIAKSSGKGLRAVALPANQAVITCLGNDIGYENIFSFQLEALAQKGDLLIALSGSGNSPNIVNAIKTAKKIGMKTFGMFGYNGGVCLKLVDKALHFKIDDMQIAEDLQVIAGHMLMRLLMK